MADNILVTGGAGFIGSHLVEALLEQGYKVRILDNLSLGRREWVHPDADFRMGDVRDLETCRQACSGCVGVFHMAAMSRSAASLDNVQICTSNNIQGSENILIAAREAAVRKLVYSGSSTFYGNQKPPHTEGMHPDFLNFYGLSKYVGEEYCLMFDRLYGLHTVVLRYFNVYGPRQSGEGVYALVLTVFLRQWHAGQPLTIHGTGSQARDFVHVRDVARANILAFEGAAHGTIYNVGSGRSIPVIQIANLVSSRHVFEPRRTADADATEADLTRIKAEIGWSPGISFEEGLAELMVDEFSSSPQQTTSG